MKHKDSRKEKLENVAFGLLTSRKKEMNDLAKEYGVTGSELYRRSVDQFLDGQCNNSLEMLNIILLTQKIHDIKEQISEKDYQECQQYIGNIMVIKGGK